MLLGVTPQLVRLALNFASENADEIIADIAASDAAH